MSDQNLHRWLYRGKRPNWIARILNSAWRAVHSSGIAANWLVTLEVTGRKSGRMIGLPLVLTIVNDQRYLVSMLGNDAQWVLNVRAANGKAVLHSGPRKPISLEDVPVEQRASILKMYLKHAPGARPHFPINMDAPLVEFEKIAANYPVFHIVFDRPTGHK